MLSPSHEVFWTLSEHPLSSADRYLNAVHQRLVKCLRTAGDRTSCCQVSSVSTTGVRLAHGTSATIKRGQPLLSIWSSVYTSRSIMSPCLPLLSWLSAPFSKTRKKEKSSADLMTKGTISSPMLKSLLRWKSNLLRRSADLATLRRSSKPKSSQHLRMLPRSSNQIVDTLPLVLPDETSSHHLSLKPTSSLYLSEMGVLRKVPL